MKRLLILAALALSLPAAAFSLINFSFSPATPLVWFEAHGPMDAISVLSGYNGVTTAAVNVAVTQRLYTRIKPIRLGLAVAAAGTGGGNMTFEAFDSTSSTSLCISSSIPCTSASSTIDCLATGVASANPGDDVVLRINAGACTGSPTGTVSLEHSQVIQDEGVDFVPRFLPYGLYGLDGGGNFFGLDGYQFDSITCGWNQAGIVSGGTDILRIQLIQKSDAGIVCSCDLPGTCADAPGSEHTCSCGGTKYMTDIPGLKGGYAVQLNSSTNCGFNPRGFKCGIPFRR